MARSWPVLNKCQLCGKTAQRKVLFFSDSRKTLQLKKIIKKICDICVNASDELPKFSCRSCCDKLVRLNKSVEEFAALCKSAQTSLEKELHPDAQEKNRPESGNTPSSTEKPRKMPHTMVTSSIRKCLSFNSTQPNENKSSALSIEKELSHFLAQNSSPSVNKSTRILTFSNYETRSKNLLGKLGLEIILEDRKIRQLAIPMYKITLGICRPYLRNIFTNVSDVHAYILKNLSLYFYIPNPKLI